MPLHDWSRLDAGIFHDFHNGWLIELRNALNNGLLPADYYALTEQHAGRFIADVLTLHAPHNGTAPLPEVGSGGTALAEAPPKVRRKLTVSSSRERRRTLAIRHVSGHRLVAVIEVVSPANKDRSRHAQGLADKIESALRVGIHVLLADRFRPGQHDPQGIHGIVWERFDDEPFELPTGESLTLAAYDADREPVAYLEHPSFGCPLPDMPLFLHPERYISAPLEATYQTAFRGVPKNYQRVLEAVPE